MALPTYEQLYQQSQDLLRGYGNAQQGALQQNYQNALGTMQQQMASSGMSGTSVAPSMRMGYMKQYQQAMNQLGDQLRQQQLQAGATYGLGGRQAQSQEELAKSQQALSQQQLELQRQIQFGQLSNESARTGIAQQEVNQRGNQMAFQQNQANPAYQTRPAEMGYNWQADPNLSYGIANSYSMMTPSGSSLFGYWG